MGHVNGFLKYKRELPASRPVEERVRDFNDIHSFYTSEQLNEQSARCMNCGVPFCHSGCPLGNDIPDFNDAVYRKQWKEAYTILSSTNNFPEFTGRICPAPCENACVLGINQSPVAIEEIEKHIIETAFEQGFVVPHLPKERTGKKVAVIGSGPAGLAAAAQLNYAGHWVTVFERDDQPGGLLMYGIPDFKLEKWVVKRRIDLMKEEGVTFKCHAYVGKNIKTNEVLRDFDAVILATGAMTPRDLHVPGRSLDGVHYAMEFLKQQNKVNAGLDPLEHVEIESNIAAQKITAEGKKVIVIGGGDTGSDCVGTSNRQNAVSVMQLTHGPLPPSERTSYMPWPTVPMIFTTSSSQEEGVEREWCLSPKEFVGTDGKLTGLKVVTLEWELTASGKRIGSKEKEGSEKIIPVDLVLIAMGFVHTTHDKLLQELNVTLDNRGNIKAEAMSFDTNIKKVFACGDARRGQSLVVWAISEGRECARKVDTFLMHSSMLEAKDKNLEIANSI